MDCFDIKVEKANAILRYKRLEKITALFRFMEVCIFLFIISRLCNHLPFAFKASGDCIRSLSVAIFSPGCLFVVGNAIILVLFLKSGQLSVEEPKSFNHTIDFCNEYVEGCGNNQVEEVKKQVKCEEKQGKKQGKCEEKEDVLDSYSFEDRKIERSHSEKLMKYQRLDSSRKLRRTVTENGRKNDDSSEASEEKFNPKCYAEDEMSGEEFRHTVEAFIARQQRSLREEFSSIVTYEP